MLFLVYDAVLRSDQGAPRTPPTSDASSSRSRRGAVKAIQLPEDLQAFAEERVRAGEYATHGQVPIHERLIGGSALTLRRHPTIGQLHAALGLDVRVFCIAQPGIKAPHGYIYRIREDEVVYIARLVHDARIVVRTSLPSSCSTASLLSVGWRGSRCDRSPRSKTRATRHS